MKLTEQLTTVAIIGLLSTYAIPTALRIIANIAILNGI